MPSPSYIPVIRTGVDVEFDAVAASEVTARGQLLGAAPSPADHGYETWTHDPYSGVTSVSAVNGRVYAVKMPVRRPRAIDTLWWAVVTAAVTPSIPSKLKMFDPIMLAIATSVRFRNAATSDVASSGAPVPPATMVSPMTRSLMPAKRANRTAPSTRKLPPATSAPTPSNRRTNMSGNRVRAPRDSATMRFA